MIWRKGFAAARSFLVCCSCFFGLGEFAAWLGPEGRDRGVACQRQYLLEKFEEVPRSPTIQKFLSFFVGFYADGELE